jgi:hypothetical protein
MWCVGQDGKLLISRRSRMCSLEEGEPFRPLASICYRSLDKDAPFHRAIEHVGRI